MGQEVSESRQPAKRLLWSYSCALVAIGLLTIVSQGLVQSMLQRQRTDGAVVNVAGRQRMLSQRLTKAALALTDALERDPAAAAEWREQLRTTRGEWVRAHYQLQSGEPSRGLPALDESDPIAVQLRALDSHVVAMADAAIHLERATARGATWIGPDLAVLLHHEAQFLPAMNDVVKSFEQSAKARVDHLRRLEAILLAVTLLVLLLEVALVFEPARRTIRRQIDRLRQERDRADQAAAVKSRFLANMSHEIRTPMTAILGFAEIAGHAGSSSKERDAALDAIERNGEHLLGIINDVLDVSKNENGNLSVRTRPTELREVVGDSMRAAELRAVERGNSLMLHVDSDVPEWASVDAGRLRQCLINLISNAVNHTHGGRIDVLLRRPAADRLVFTVRDEGEGISNEDLERVFRPFEQADDSNVRAHAGTGLGLTLTQALARAMGGDVQVESQQGVGSSFHLTIEAPAVEAPPSGPSQGSKETVPQVDLSGLDVLVADDNADNRRLLKSLLERRGARVVLAEDGVEAVDRALAASRTQQPFDIVLLDVQMPVMDGVEAHRRLREQGFRRPVVAVTAHAMDEQRQELLAEGFDDFLSKPVRPASLWRVVDALGNRAGSRRRQRLPS